MRLLDWILGRGRNPLEVPAAATTTRVPDEPAPERSAPDDELRRWATAMGVTPEVMSRLVEARAALVADIAGAPRSWGLDLVPHGASRRDAASEFRQRTHLQGQLAESFLVDHGALLDVVPDPPTMPDGTPLDALLVRAARLTPDAARDIAQHVRRTIQATLGAPLDPAAVEHAVREAAWDHELDAAVVTPHVLRALNEVLHA